MPLIVATAATVTPARPVLVPTDEETEMLNVLVPAAKSRRVAGPDQLTAWNACVDEQAALGQAEDDSSVQVFCYDLTGKLLGHTNVLPLTGNKPAVAGPNEVFGVASDIGATGPCILAFYAGVSAISVSLHGL
jgi:hypothetical protein